MLFDFHRNENNKKPNSVNATYIITGIQKAPETPPTTNGLQDSFDGIPQSSPYISSSMPNQDVATDEIAMSSVVLVREEDLEGTWNCFHCVTQRVESDN